MQYTRTRSIRSNILISQSPCDEWVQVIDGNLVGPFSFGTSFSHAMFRTNDKRFRFTIASLSFVWMSQPPHSDMPSFLNNPRMICSSFVRPAITTTGLSVAFVLLRAPGVADIAPDLG